MRELVFVDSQATARPPARNPAWRFRAVVRFDVAGADGLAHFEARGAEIRAAHPEFPGAYEATLLPDDLAVLIYTSGTTGLPQRRHALARQS